MKLFSRKRAIRMLTVYAALGLVFAGLTVVERRRIEATASEPSASAVPGPLDGQPILADIRTLADPRSEGRRTGGAGNRSAQDFIETRFREIGAAPAFASYRQRFSFTRHSVRGFFLPSRPFKTVYPEAANVGAIIRGTGQPERFIALTAHYDGLGIRDGQVYPGADDNASGVAVMLAVGRMLAAQPLQHSVLLLAFDGEELGLQGSTHFVANPAVDLALMDVVINLDMVGRGDTNTLVAAGTALYPALEPPVRAAAASRSVKMLFGHDRPFYLAGAVGNWTQSSDQGPFHDAGVPFVYLGVEDHADFHRATDTVEKIQPAFLGEVGNLVLGLIGRLDRAGSLRGADR